MDRRGSGEAIGVVVAATALAIVPLVVGALITHGDTWFFRDGDAPAFLAVAREPFGTGRGLARLGLGQESAYRYGRIGLPLLAWILVAGRPALVPWPLLTIHVLSIVAIPGLAAALLDAYGAPALGGLFVMLAPGLLLVRDRVYAEPLCVALILVAYLFEARGRRRSALAVLALAILVKEIAILALIPWAWRAMREQDRRRAVELLGALVPYAVWSVWVRIRIGQFPLFARTSVRTEAFGFPGAGMRDMFLARAPDYRVDILLTLLTGALCLAAAWSARRFPIAGLAAGFGVMVLCYGPSALALEGELLRLLIPAQVVGLLCIVLAATTSRSRGSSRVRSWFDWAGRRGRLVHSRR